jgi:hypothetical protein
LNSEKLSYIELILEIKSDAVPFQVKNAAPFFVSPLTPMSIELARANATISEFTYIFPDIEDEAKEDVLLEIVDPSYFKI